MLNQRFPLDVWTRELRAYRKKDYILDGLKHGFRIGVEEEKAGDGSQVSDKPHFIPLSNPEKQGVTAWILKGLQKGFICGPYDKDYKFSFGKLHIAPTFVVPKPIGYRPVVNLSHRGLCTYSVNDLICKYMKTVRYIRFREVVNLVNNAGKGAFIFLIDAQDAYYRVPTHPDDWKYMGISWAQKYWVFRCLQMGCSSSPKIYTEFADAVEYICVNRNNKIAFYKGLQQLRHYIDDFFAALPTKEMATELYESVFKTFADLGVPTRRNKCKAVSYTHLTLPTTPYV